jgi:GR25 family glycosyltransferase involved in LPS biosynthesis
MLQFPIYYINLASRPDRREFMEEQFARLGLSAERIEAVTPSDLTAEQVSIYCDPLRSRSMTKAQYACNQSHARAWGRLIASGAEAAVIFEDDAVLSPSLPEFLAQLPNVKADIIRIETFPEEPWAFAPRVEEMVSTFTLRECLDRTAGSGGYILSRRAASAALSAPNFHFRLVDGFLFDPFGLGRQLSTRHVDPGLAVQLCKIGAERPETQSNIIGGEGVTEYERQRSRRGPLKRLAKQARVWAEYDIPRAAAAIRALMDRPERRSISFKAD